MSQAPSIFNRRLFARNRNRAAKHFSHHDFLVRDALENIAERLEDSTRHFPLALEVGCRLGGLAARLSEIKRVDRLVQLDISPVMLRHTPGICLLADEEFLPFAPGAFDLIVSALHLHTVNDLPGALIQLRKALKPDGVFMVSLFGGETLTELRQSLMAAELECGQGVAPHIAPFVDTKDAGMLMQRAGFSMPVADSYTLTASYDNIIAFMHDLRGMGEGNVLMMKKNYGLNRRVLSRAAAHYAERFPLDEGRIKATFEIITLTGMGVA